MKKILSLLVLLVTTLSAFALDFTDYRKVTLGSNTPTESNDAKLSITDNGDGTYNVTFNDIINKDGSYTDKYGTFVFSNVSGSQTGDFTTVTGTQLTGTVTGGDYGLKSFTGGELLVKFKEGKAYATMTAKCKVFYSDYTFDVVFGTDEGFGGGSTGGGETGGETSSIVTVKENFQSTQGVTWGENVTIDWNTQKLVVSVNLASTGSDKGFLGVTKQGQSANWNNYGIIFYNVDGTTVQGYAPGQYDNGNTHYITKGEDPVRFEISKDGGVKCQGNVVISAALIAHLTNQSNIVVGAADKVAGALYNYIKVVPLNWSEVPPVTVKETKEFKNVAYTTSMGGSGTATVTFTEMSDGTFPMTFVSDDLNVKAENLTKGTDDKGRTTYTGTAKRTDVDVTFTVKAVVYEKDNTARLYMTMVTGVTTVVVGENPDNVTPEVTEVSNKTYTNNLRIFDGEEPVVENAEAQVNIIKYSDESYKVTLKDVNILNKTQDLVFVGSAIVEEGPAEGAQPLTIMAKSDEATTTVFDEQVSGTFEITEVSADEIKMGFSMESQNFSYMGEFNYTEEEEPEVYTNNLHIYDAAAPETDLFQADQAKVEFLATATGEFKLTLKDVTLNENTKDLVFTGMLSAPEPGGQDPLAEEGETTPAETAMVLNAIADEATATFLGATSATAVFNVIMNDEAETENDAFALTFAITAGDKTLGGEFNYEKTPDVEEYPINFDKTAKSTHNSRALNSFSLQQTGKDKQTESVYASKAAYEDHTSKVFTVEAGSELTASFDYTGEWMHSFVYIDFDNDGQFSYKEGQWDQTGTDLVAFSFYSLDSNPKNDASGYNSVGDELTGDARNTYAAPSFKAPAKAGEYRIRFKFDWNCILPAGSSTILEDGGGIWDATLKVVEPVVDGISTINAETANGEAQLFTIDGVKLNKLQKGLNIVRTADGKVKKVLVK